MGSRSRAVALTWLVTYGVKTNINWAFVNSKWSVTGGRCRWLWTWTLHWDVSNKVRRLAGSTLMQNASFKTYE
jgi:hypothetical protein